MEKCNLHTILRLPTGIFYKPGVKTNVLFFQRGLTNFDNTKHVWYYDLRSDMHFTLVENPIKKDDFKGFIEAYKALDRDEVHDDRWNCYDVNEIKARGNIFDFGIIKKDSDKEYTQMKDPIEYAVDCVSQIEESIDLINSVIVDLKKMMLSTNIIGKFKIGSVKDIKVKRTLVDEIAPKYADRKGGYTRMIKIGMRKGDGAPEVIIELV